MQTAFHKRQKVRLMTQLDNCRDTCGLSKWLHFSRTEIARATDIQGTECRLDQFSPSRALSTLLSSVLIDGLASKTSNQSMRQNSEHLTRSGRNKRLLKSTDLTKDSVQIRSICSAVLREWAGFNFFRVTCGTGLLLAAGSSAPLGGSGPFTALRYSRLDILHKMTTQFIKTTSVLQQTCFL